MSKYKNLFDGYKIYFFHEEELPIEDFFKLEDAAGLENEINKHQIFFVYAPTDNLKIVSGLN